MVEYDAFGFKRSDFMTARNVATYTDPVGFGGQFGYYTDESGLSLLTHRYYDPQNGRTLTLTNFTLAVSPGSVSIMQVTSQNATVTVNPLYGFGGNVSLSASNLPSGVTASFYPASTTRQSTVTFSASSDAVTGPATVTLTGTSGALTHTVSLPLFVQDNSPYVSSIYVSPSSATVLVNQQVQFTAYANDQFGRAINPPFSWGVTGGGSISPSGLFTAGSAAGGPYTVTASVGGVKGSASVTVINPYVVVTPNPVSLAPYVAQQFTATAYNQDGTLLNPQPTFTWSGTGGSISQTGYYTAGSMTGPFAVTATSSSGNASASINITTSGGSGNGTPTGADPYFNVSGGHVDVTQGSNGTTTSGSATFSVTSSNGFVGTIIPSLSGLPPGVTAIFSPAALNINGTSSVIGNVSFSVPSTVLPGFYSLMLKVSSGSISDSTLLSLTVHPIPNNANFGLSADIDTIVTYPATTGPVTLSLSTVPGFSGNVSLSVADDPSRSILTSSGGSPFSPATLSSNGTTSILNLQIAAGVPTGVYHLLVTGTSSSGSQQLVPLIVYIPLDESNSVPETMPACQTSINPPAPTASSIADMDRIDYNSNGSQVLARSYNGALLNNDNSLIEDGRTLLRPDTVGVDDNRIYIGNTYPNGVQYPFDAVCRVVASFPGTNQTVVGTGTLVGNKHVLTAAHVLFYKGVPASQVEVFPAYDNGVSRFHLAFAQADRSFIPRDYRKAIALITGVPPPLFDDYALLDLQPAVVTGKGSQQYSLGYYITPMRMASDFQSPEQITYIAGYPQWVNDTFKGSAHMFYSYVGNGDDGPVTGELTDPSIPHGYVHFTIDISGGDSGGGLWRMVGTDPFAHVYAVVDDEADYYNDAALITPTRLSILNNHLFNDGDGFYPYP